MAGGLELHSASDSDHATVSGQKDHISVVRESSPWPCTNYFDEMYSPHSSIWDLPEALEGGPFTSFECYVPPRSLSAIKETLHGTIWSLIDRLLDYG